MKKLLYCVSIQHPDSNDKDAGAATDLYTTIQLAVEGPQSGSGFHYEGELRHVPQWAKENGLNCHSTEQTIEIVDTV